MQATKTLILSLALLGLALAQTAPRENPLRVRFLTAKGTEILVQPAENPTARDFLALLPLTLEFRDINRMEKTADLPRRLATQGSRSHVPQNGTSATLSPGGISVSTTTPPAGT